ncbi:hypothetical protein DFJ58DRAFT_818527, partial [Suillus subalutaceus]|uniref:uncharacterized protein n=1 Tax=Suillus subalutaceus TaxID=48586 RepID=UPI001B8809CA
MKRTTDVEQLAAFPIDEEIGTFKFGRDPACNVHLYYPEISARLCFWKDRCMVYL